jgi:hypothetical protein
MTASHSILGDVAVALAQAHHARKRTPNPRCKSAKPPVAETPTHEQMLADFLARKPGCVEPGPVPGSTQMPLAYAAKYMRAAREAGTPVAAPGMQLEPAAERALRSELAGILGELEALDPRLVSCVLADNTVAFGGHPAADEVPAELLHAALLSARAELEYAYVPGTEQQLRDRARDCAAEARVAMGRVTQLALLRRRSG